VSRDDALDLTRHFIGEFYIKATDKTREDAERKDAATLTRYFTAVFGALERLEEYDDED
jgi:hypothetical protein